MDLVIDISLCGLCTGAEHRDRGADHYYYKAEIVAVALRYYKHHQKTDNTYGKSRKQNNINSLCGKVLQIAFSFHNISRYGTLSKRPKTALTESILIKLYTKLSSKSIYRREII